MNRFAPAEEALLSKEYSFPRPEFFDLRAIFDCGQCFRFEEIGPGLFEGVVGKRALRLRQTADKITLFGADASDFSGEFRRYFALDADYRAIRAELSDRAGGNGFFLEAMDYGAGIRILRQDPWETLCSFILSQNNNIPRIKKLVASLSSAFGEPISAFGKIFYTFPTPQALLFAGKEKIFAQKTGFRAGYLADAAQRVASGELDLPGLECLPTEELISSLMRIRGVGRKVASCTALFGFGKTDAFPVDVNIRHILADAFPGDFSPAVFGRYAGIAQQYLFYYERDYRKKTAI